MASFVPPRARPLPSLEIQLTEQEDRLCTLLDDCSKHIAETHPELPRVECRIAGGWVRDKVRPGGHNYFDHENDSLLQALGATIP